jgi:copper chaperone NosL
MAAGLIAGCGQVDICRPPTIRFGEEACASCRMIIGDERFAAALVAPTGDALKFDDIGCLVEHEAGGLRSDAAYWVRDAVSREWLDAREARFVHSPSVASPMGFGLAASGRPVGGQTGRPDVPLPRATRLPCRPVAGGGIRSAEGGMTVRESENERDRHSGGPSALTGPCPSPAPEV